MDIVRLEDFKIGSTFRCGDKTWLCTDMGTRVITAICIDPACSRNDYLRGLPEEAQESYWKRPEVPLDTSWFSGPPYALVEQVFDEDDMKGCTT